MWCFWSLLCSNPTLFVKIDRHPVAFIGMGPAVKMFFDHQIDVYVLTVIIKEFTRPPMSSFVTSRTVNVVFCVGQKQTPLTTAKVIFQTGVLLCLQRTAQPLE